MIIDAKLVSVIIPSYNYSTYISDAINSILEQTYTNWEVIVVDDGSKDNTADVVSRFTARDSRIKYHYQQNKGLSAARNTGLLLAKGEYIQLLDADDYIAPKKMELQVGVLLADETAALVYGDTYNFQHSNDVSARRELNKFKLQVSPVTGKGDVLAMHMAYDNLFLPGNPLFRKELAVRIGSFDERLFSLEDWHFWYRGVLKGAKFVYDNQIGTEFIARAHGNNMSGNRYKMWKYKIQARQSLIQTIRALLQNREITDINLNKVLEKHKVLLYEEQARFNLLYENVGAGVYHTINYSLRGEKPMRIWYDSAYWLKERLLGHNKKLGA